MRSYLLDDEAIDSPHFDIHGLEVAVPYDEEFKQLRFRMYNNDICIFGNEVGCSPRCVEIERNGASSALEANEYLVYDCELGFYASPTKISSMVHGSTYALQICMDEACNSYYLNMPGKDDSKLMPDQLVLLEEAPLLFDAQLVLQFPPSMRSKEHKNVTIKIDSPEEEEVITVGNVDPDGRLDMFIGYHLTSDTSYSIFYQHDGNWIKVAHFRTFKANQTALGIALFLFFAACLGAAVFFVHRRYNHVQKINQVNPNRLLESGRIEPRNVLIISNVDNRHHIDVVLGFSKYLKVSNIFWHFHNESIKQFVWLFSPDALRCRRSVFRSRSQHWDILA